MREGGREQWTRVEGVGEPVMLWRRRRRRDAEKEERLKLRSWSSAGGGDESRG